MKELEELFIPFEFYKTKELNSSERCVLAIYRHYTIEDEQHYCSVTNSQIADYLNISVVYVKKIKKHLKELGYIKTDGTKVIYLGVKKHTNKE